MSTLSLVGKYALFAVISITANLGFQEMTITLYSGPWALYLSMIVGTGAGLVIKYVLDKRYIFRFAATSRSHDGQVFILYSSTGVFTTLIFWGFELGFNFVMGESWRYIGAVLGLSIGYWLKYTLDKHFVFRNNRCD